MSGILAILRTDDAPVDADHAKNLTRSPSMLLRGPDAQHTWCDGSVALGHALLRTTHEAAHEQQPLSLDGRVWIVADGRVDARADLIAELGEDPRLLSTRPDVELILRAYQRWGRECVQHLLGDFAFAIWDGRNRHLFCARDHMGVKPFYYAHVSRSLLVSSTIETLRLHPDVSDALNDLAIADFLLFGLNQEQDTTSFKDIQILPPAHTLTWSTSGITIQRYWTLPIDEPVYYRRNHDYVDRFNELVQQAVTDRLRTDRVGVFMSGGLDSPMLAAAAQKNLAGAGRSAPVKAFSFFHASSLPDPERGYAEMAARHIGIPIQFYEMAVESEWAPTAAAAMPEPAATITDDDVSRQCYADMVGHSRVAFYGEGPDNALLYEWKPHLAYLAGQRRWGRLAADVARHIVSHKRVPILPTIPRMFRARREWKQHHVANFPEWINPELERRLSLRERWHAWEGPSNALHPVRPRGYASLLTSQWQAIFAGLEPSYTGVGLEVRHPFVDTRLLRFMLQVPALPWSRAKHVQRRALRGVVPEAVRRRPKTPVSADVSRAQFRRPLPPVHPSASLAAYGRADSTPGDGMRTIADMSADLRFIALSYWLSSGRLFNRVSQTETYAHG